MASPSSSSIVRLLEGLKVAKHLEKGQPGFSAAFGFTYDQLSKLLQLLPTTTTSTTTEDHKNDTTSTTSSSKHINFDETSNTLTVKLPVTKDKLLIPGGRSSISLSTYLAIIDDATTWCLVLSDRNKRGRAGVSVSLSASWCSSPSPATTTTTAFDHDASDAVDEKDDDDNADTSSSYPIVVRAKTRKIGRNLGFVEAEIVEDESSTGDDHVVCIASHIKYLPMGIVGDFLQSSYGWNLTKWLYNGSADGGGYDDDKHHDSAVPSPSPPIPRMDSLFDSLQFQSDNSATFQVTPSHASLGGPIHGGCQAILHELVATEYVKRKFPADTSYHLSSMTVDYLARPSSKEVQLKVVEMQPPTATDLIQYYDNDCFPVRVQLLCSGKVISEGLLHFTKSLSATTTPLVLQSKL